MTAEDARDDAEAGLPAASRIGDGGGDASRRGRSATPVAADERQAGNGPRSSDRQRLAAAAAWLGALVGPTVIWVTAVYLAGSAASPDVGPEECEGIGWGCVLSPRDGIWFAGAVYGLFAVPVATVVAVVAVAMAPRHRRIRAALVALGCLAVVVAVLAAVAVEQAASGRG